MLRHIIIAFLLITSLLVSPQRIVSEELKIYELSYKDQIAHFSKLYGVDPVLMSTIVRCESRFKPTARGDGGKAYGLLQFWEDSFKRMEKALGEDLDYYSAHDQIKLGTYAIANGYGREWTSYRSIMNGGKYSFYSKQLKRNFTVYCRL